MGDMALLLLGELMEWCAGESHRPHGPKSSVNPNNNRHFMDASALFAMTALLV